MRSENTSEAPNRSDADREPISPAELAALAERLSLLASPQRIALLIALQDGESSVGDLAERLDLRHQKASHHLGLLLQAGVVTRRLDGASSLYSIADWTLPWVVDQLSRALADDQ